MPEVLVLQHVACEPLGTIENALRRLGLSHRYIRAQDGERAPQDIGDAAGLIIMGGPMGAYDEARYPFLADEKRLIGQAVTAGLPTLGICLGGQLLASVLGAPIQSANQAEIGWHSVTLTPEAGSDTLWQGISSPWNGFHWHGDFFEAPPGAVSLASSTLSPCQAFRFGTAVYGFQFHLEVTETIIRDWTAAFAGELVKAGLDADHVTNGIAENLPPMRTVAENVFERWASLAAKRVYGTGAAGDSR